MSKFLTIFLTCIPYLLFAKIFIVGDSHSLEFSGIQQTSIHHLGPITMYRVGRDQLNMINLEKMGARNNDTAIFCFGEIDARCHVGKRRDELNLELDTIIKELCNNYLNAIISNQKLFPQLKCIVYSITPPTDIAFNPLYPTYGSLEDRVLITKRFNQILHANCILKGIKFLDVYNDYADQSGVLRPDLSDGNVHINPTFNLAIKDKLTRLVIER